MRARCPRWGSRGDDEEEGERGSGAAAEVVARCAVD